MPLSAAIFDLDDTLLDSSMLRDARDQRRWANVYRRLSEVRPFLVGDGEVPIVSLPAEARQRGLAVGLLTHSPTPYATELLRAHGIKVDAVVTGSDGYAPKPDPAGLLAVASQLGVEAAECAYIGDSVGDFGAAAAAGSVAVGVAWNRETPASWHHGWPDVAVDRPSRLLRFLGGATGYGLLGEEQAARVQPTIHWGSVMRLGGSKSSLGRYFQTGDARFPDHALSQLILRAKNDGDAAMETVAVFETLATHIPVQNTPELICSVPPKPDAAFDRFIPVRAALAAAFSARDGDEILEMLFDVADYKHVPRDEREERNRERFTAQALNGERVLLIDDVFTSGGQSEACRRALRDAGAGPVSILTLAVAQDRLSFEPCECCGAGMRTRTRGRDGKQFLGCSNYPNCRFTRDLP